MKFSYGIFLIVFLLSFSKVWGQKENNSVLEKKISLEAKNESIASVLELITAKHQVFFSYDAVVVEVTRRTDISVNNKSIRDILNLLFDSKFEYKVLGDQIIITNPGTAKQDEKVIEPEKEKSQIIIFRGRVIDREEKDALPYTSISVLRSNIGTISNSDGDFELKIPGEMKLDTVVFSCLGYRLYRQPINEITEEPQTIYLQPTSVQLKEIKVSVINPDVILSKILDKISFNYSRDPEIMTSFYREVLKQDNDYIDIAEALMEIRKAPYENDFAQDKVKFIKGRKSMDVKPFQYIDFKIQGGPYYITMLDVVKTLDSFLDPEFRDFYKYSLEEIVELNERETYVVRFRPREKVDYPCYQGKLYVDMSSFALVHAEFSLSRSGLKFAHESLIKKKPKDFYVRPIHVDYQVSYRRINTKWHLSNAVASIKFRVRSKKDKVNSIFHSVSELLVTDIRPDDGTHFKRAELFNPRDIFTDLITTYDEGYWGKYNTIIPSEDLRNALKDYAAKNDSLFKSSNKN